MTPIIPALIAAVTLHIQITTGDGITQTATLLPHGPAVPTELTDGRTVELPPDGEYTIDIRTSKDKEGIPDVIRILQTLTNSQKDIDTNE